MKRCPVLLHLALIAVALFADDAHFLFLGTAADDVATAAALHADSPVTTDAIRLADGMGAAVEVARQGKPVRDGGAQPVSEFALRLTNAYCAALLTGARTTLAASTLVLQHTRLQI